MIAVRTLKIDVSVFWLPAFIILSILSAGCTRPASRATLAPALSEPSVTVNEVTVHQGSGISIQGQATLPSGGCLKTELRIDGDIASWWPVDVCIEPDGGRWEMVVPLGRKGAPEALPDDGVYEIHAWWADHPEDVQDRFPFDLTGPKSVDETPQGKGP